MRLIVGSDTAVRNALVQPFLQDRRKRRVLETLAVAPVDRLSINQIAERLDEDFGYVKRVLESLDRFGGIRLVKDDTRYRIEAVHDCVAALAGTARTAHSGRESAIPTRG